jgi:hypothetical protein
MLSLCKYYTPHPTLIAFSALCSHPTISQPVYAHDAANDNDAMTFIIEFTEGSFLADRRLHFLA